MITERNKPGWWGISKLEILEPLSNSAYIYCNRRNRITISLNVIPITKDHTVLGKDELSDEEIKKHIFLIDAIDENPLIFYTSLAETPLKEQWSYTDNVDPDNPDNKFVKTPFSRNRSGVTEMSPSEPTHDAARLIKFNIYCKARVGGESKKIAVKIIPPDGETITSLNGPSTSGAAFITVTTLTPLEYKPEHIIPYYYPWESAENACDADGSAYRIVELKLNSTDYTLVASEIFGNQKSTEDIKVLKKLYFDNESEFLWIHRIAVLPEGAYSYYCWGFDHVPEKPDTDDHSKDNPYNLGRGHSYCYVKVNEILTRNQEKFYILIISQSKSGSSSSTTRDMPIKLRLYDQYGNKGEFILELGENLCVENGKTSPGVTLKPTIIV